MRNGTGDGRVQLTTHQFRRQILIPSSLQTIDKSAVTHSTANIPREVTNVEITEAVETPRFHPWRRQEMLSERTAVPSSYPLVAFGKHAFGHIRHRGEVTATMITCLVSSVYTEFRTTRMTKCSNLNRSRCKGIFDSTSATDSMKSTAYPLGSGKPVATVSASQFNMV